MNREKDMANYTAVFFVFISALCLLFPSARIAQSLRILSSYSLYPSLHYGSNYDYFIRNVPDNVLKLLQTDQENRALTGRIKELEISVKTAEAVREENTRLTREMGLSSNLPLKGIWARVVNKNTQDWYGVFFINKGARDGVAVNSTVIGFENDHAGLAGRVFEVYQDFSKVLLITNSVSSVICSGPGANFEGLAEGRGTWLLKVNYIPEGSDISEGRSFLPRPADYCFPRDCPWAACKKSIRKNLS